MIPVWIFDFIKKGSIESFLSNYHNALTQNDPTMDPARWFHVTEGLNEDYSQAVLEQTAQALLVDNAIDGKMVQKLIPVWNNRTNRFLNVIFTGDIDDEATQKHLISSAVFLLKNRTYFPGASVRFYALLWRSSASTVEPGLSPGAFQFMKDLKAMLDLDENNRFHKVLFFESSLLPEEKAKAMESMALATLQIAVHEDLGNGDELVRQYKNVLYNAGAAGTFYEKDVQKEQETFFLSNILLDALVNGNGPGMVNPIEATSYLDKQGDFFRIFEATNIAETLKRDCPTIPADKATYSVESEVSPFSLDFRAVWRKYFNDYVVNLKRNIINRLKRILSEFTKNYQEFLYIKQAEFVNSLQTEIENKVFAIFKNSHEHNALSLQQALDVLEKIRKRIDSLSQDVDTSKIEAFVFPKNLEKARDQFEQEIQSGDPDEVISTLERRLRKHPVMFFSLLVRSFVLGALLCYTGVTFFMSGASVPAIWAVGFGLFLLPILISFWNFREYLVRIESLKDQYAAAMIMKCQKNLNQDLLNCIDKSYKDIDTLINWIKTHKIELLQKNLAAACPPDFSFASSPRFQPLVKCMPYGTGAEGQVLMPVSNVNLGGESELSGSFGKNPILVNPPVSKVYVRGDRYSFDEIIHDKGLNLLRDLLRDLFDTTAVASGNIEHNVKFEALRTPRTKLLLLDVSGSMSKDDMSQLKSAVAQLSMTATIKWIAFNEKVVAIGDSAEELESITSGGGTKYIPAIQAAKAVCDTTFVDQVILISDGMPFEQLGNIIEEAHKLMMPIHTISIGNSGASVMKEISEKTSGEQIIVKDIKDLAINVESKFNQIFTIGLTGEYTFAELMQKCYFSGCAEALHKFASSKMASGASTLVDLIVQHAGDAGLREWSEVAQETCTHNEAVPVRRHEIKTYVQLSCDPADADRLEKRLSGTFASPVVDNVRNSPEIVVSTLSLCPLTSIYDIKWFFPNVQQVRTE